MSSTREPGFDLAVAIARPGFTPAVRDAGALVALLESPERVRIIGSAKNAERDGERGGEAVVRDATRALVALRAAGREALLRRLGAAGSGSGGAGSAGGGKLGSGGAPELLDDGAATRMITALGAIARTGDAAATRALLPLVTAPGERWRRAAVVALGKLGGDAARGLSADASVDAAVNEARAVVMARWDAEALSAAERRALTEALGKLGGGGAVAKLTALAPGEDAELARRRDRALLMSRRDQSRRRAAVAPIGEGGSGGGGSGAVGVGDSQPDSQTNAQIDSQIDSQIDAAAAVPAMKLAWSCRSGMGPLLAEELRALGHELLERQIDGAVTRFSGPLSAVFAARLWTQIGLVAPLGEGELAAAIPAAICQPAVRGLLTALTRGAVRWRLEMASGGPRRGLVWQVVRDVAARAPEMINEPADTTWTIIADERRRTLLLRPRRLEDPRFAWRLMELPSASHPTVAAAVAALAKPRGGERVWDPFTGSGSELIECSIAAARSGGGPLELFGSDLDPEALAAATSNIAAAGLAVALVRADARDHRPGAAAASSGAIDLIASNPPLGGRLRGDAGQLLCDALPNFAAALRRGGRLVWITPSPKRTTPVAEELGLVLDRAFDVDLGGMRARLERWLKP